MKDDTLWQADDATASGFEAPAEVYLLHVGKEAGVKSAHCLVVVATDEEGGA